MGTNISPGVYSKIIDLSTYVQAVPGTIGYIAAITKKGEDNTLRFVGRRSELINEWGEPNITDYGKNFGQGLYDSYNFLGESGSLYFMRVLPDDATFSNIRIDAIYDAATDTSAAIELSYVDSLNTKGELTTNLSEDGTRFPLCFLYPIGRGEYYNNLAVRLTEHSNPLADGIFNLDIYEKQSDGDEVIVESFEISFNPMARDSTGDSIWIQYVLNNYSSMLRCSMEVDDNVYTTGYDVAVKKYDTNIGSVQLTDYSSTLSSVPQVYTIQPVDGETYVVGNVTYKFATAPAAINDIFIGADVDASYTNLVAAVNGSGVGDGSDYFAGTEQPLNITGTVDGLTDTVTVTLETIVQSTIIDNKQDFTDWKTDAGMAAFMMEMKDDRGNKATAWIGQLGTDSDTVVLYTDRAMTVGGINASVNFDVDSDSIEYVVKKTVADLASPFIASTPVPLKKGSEGSLVNPDGTFNSTEGENLLAQAYAGQIDEDVLDTENIYFNLVFDCGYTSNVKTAISTMVQTRRDCVAVMDNGDNATYELAMAKRNDDHTFNNYFCALFEPYNKVYDSFTGQDIWVSATYHMSYLIPRNDSLQEIWFATAGYDAAAIDQIKALRFNPKLGQRDQMYLKQLNPIVKFNPGYVVWGNLTSQAKPSALQDINIVRLVLYVKRALERFCKFYIFKQNDEITWSEVSQQVVDFLEEIKKRRGLYGYTVDVGASDYEKKRKTFHVDVTLEPTRVVEKIELNFFIK